MIRRVLIIDEDPDVKPPQPPQFAVKTTPTDRTLDDSSSTSATSNRSPFQRVKRHVKQIMTGEQRPH